MAPIIRELSKSMINKIAAGEVVERPANVVKELIENSIDAGATRIDVEVEKSGVELIKIVDNGCGITANQLVLALSPHSTSKVSEPDDLFRIHTLGFRGEALASIAEVSQLVLSSRSVDSDEGAQIRSDGGTLGEIQPIGRAVGTTIEARNLFFNVPARRKFLKSQATEFGHIQEAVYRVALPNSGVAFTLTHNGRKIIDVPSTDGLKDRARRLLGEDVASRLVAVDSSYKNVRVSGYVGLPDLSRPTQALQYVFLNGRFIRDRSLQHALSEAYRGLLLTGRYPVVLLNVQIPPDFVDVNVHPTKMEVRFVDGSAIYAGLLSAIREQFLRSDIRSRPNDSELDAAAKRARSKLDQNDAPENKDVPPEKTPNAETSRVDAPKKKEAPKSDEGETRELRFVPDVDPGDPIAALDDKVAEAKRKDLLGWFKNADAKATSAEETFQDASQARLDVDAANAVLEEAAAQEREERVAKNVKRPESRQVAPNAFSSSSGNSAFRKFPPLPNDAASRPLANERQVPSNERGAFGNVDNSSEGIRARVVENNQGTLRSKAPMRGQVARDSKGRPVVQICDRYLVMETDDGMAVVDQHALHERILYEKLKEGYDSDKLDVQRLLVPDVVDLSPVELPFVLENRESFAKLGILVDSFGGTSVVVNGYPALLRGFSPKDAFLAALGALRQSGKAQPGDLFDAALKQMACKAAIKAGDYLRPDAVIELIVEAEREVNSHHCPHGRPSTLLFSCEELDKLFKRL